MEFYLINQAVSEEKMLNIVDNDNNDGHQNMGILSAL